MSYPIYAKVNGEKYPLNTSYKAALRCFDIVNDDEISDMERALAIIYILFGFIPDDEYDKFLDVAIRYLGCGSSQEEQRKRNRDMDFKQDWGYIEASFASDYHIDLSQTDMHFYKFIDLIQGLTDSSVLSRVREIRNYDLSDIKDAKTKRKIAKAQDDLRLKEAISREEQEAIDEFEALFR